MSSDLENSLRDSIVGQRVEQARCGENPYLIAQMRSGWLVMADKQMLPGHLILLADPVVSSINDVDAQVRRDFMSDMVKAGDALLAVTDSFRINYEILGNTDPALHGHIVPRYLGEPLEKRIMPVWFYDWHGASAFNEKEHGKLQCDLRNWLT